MLHTPIGLGTANAGRRGHAPVLTLVRCAASIVTTALLLAATTRASDERPTREFFSELLTRYRAEYRACTGDSAAVADSTVVAWRTALSDRIEQLNYPSIVKEYIAATGANKSDVLPCKVVEWNDVRRRREAAIAADSTGQRLVAASGARVQPPDSATVARALASLRDKYGASSFDMAGIPFGVTLRECVEACRITLRTEPMREATSVLVRRVVVDSAVLDVRFYFSRRGSLYRYDFLGRALPADSLDRVVRGEAAGMAGVLTRAVGKPRVRYYAGLFDFAEGALTVLGLWRDKNHLAQCGIIKQDYRYRAWTVVIDTKRNADRGAEDVVTHNPEQ